MITQAEAAEARDLFIADWVANDVYSDVVSIGIGRVGSNGEYVVMVGTRGDPAVLPAEVNGVPVQAKPGVTPRPLTTQRDSV